MRGDMQVRFGGRYGKTYCRKAVRRSVPSLRLGKGGDIFTLAGELAQSGDFMEQVKFIADAANMTVDRLKMPTYQPEPTEPVFERLEAVPLLRSPLTDYLAERGIPYAVASRHCCRLNYGVRGKRYFTVGFPNVAGGYEIRSRYFKGCIPPKDVSLIKPEDTASDVCSVFEGFMDYLSFLTLRQESCPNYPELDGQDYIVLNSVSNVNKALYPLGNYERIHCFFDNDHAGMEALRQIRMEYGRDRYIRDASQIYSGCKDLNEYLQKQVERKRQLQSAKGVRSQSPEKKSGFRL